MIKVKVTLAPVEVMLDPTDFQARWEEKCDEDDDYEDRSYPPMPDSFVLSEYQTSIEDGDEDVAAIFESASVAVEEVKEEKPA